MYLFHIMSGSKKFKIASSTNHFRIEKKNCEIDFTKFAFSITVTSSHALLIQMSVFSSELTYQVLKIFFSPRKCSIEAPARCKTSVYVLIEICHQWAKRFITLFGKYPKKSWNWFLFFPNLFGVYTFMKIYIFFPIRIYI